MLSPNVEGTDVVATASAAVTVEEGLEPINFVNVDDTVKSDDGDVFLTYLSAASDVDVFEVTLQQDERLVVGLSELDADLDLVLWGRPAASSVRPHGDEQRSTAVRDHRP